MKQTESKTNKTSRGALSASTRIVPPRMEKCRAHSFSNRFLKAGLAALLVLLLAGVFCGAAAAEGETSGTSGGIQWSISDDKTLTISPADTPMVGYDTGEMPNYTPGSKSAPWIGLGACVLDIKDGVTNIGKNAFYSSSSLTSLTIPDSVTSIGDSAFLSSPLTSLTIPATVTSIGDYAFNTCSLEYPVTIPSGVKTIGNDILGGQMKSYCTFVGWYDNKECTGEPVSQYKAGKTYWPKWTSSYQTTVTLDAQGGTGGTVSITATYAAAMPTATMPTKDGYTFTGYYDDNAPEIKPKYYNADGTSARNWDKISPNATLYAHWEQDKPTYTVSFKGNKPSEAAGTVENIPKDISGVVQGTTISAPITTPTLTGYTFGGWYKEEECTNAWNFTTDVVNTDTSLYAKWTPNTYTVKYDANGGSGTAMDSQTFTYGVAQKLRKNTYTKDGYTFAGWDKDSAGTTVDYTDEQSVSNLTTTAGDIITLYAVWGEEPKTITKGTMTGGDVVVSSDETGKAVIDKAAKGTTVYLKPAAATGYTYTASSLAVADKDGNPVSTEATATSGVSKFTMPDSAVTVTAVFTANTYTVTLDAQGGTGGTGSITATYAAAMPTATMPTRAGYTFTGYYDDASAGTQYYTATGASAKNWDKAVNTTLYAHWTPKTYTITLSQEGVDEKGTETVTVTYDSSLITPAIRNPVKHGYSLDGWYMNGKKVIGGDGQFVSGVEGCTDADGHWIHDGNLTLTAVLTPTQKDVTPDPGEPAVIDAETVPLSEDGSLVKVVSADKVTSASFDADAGVNAPETDASGYRLEKTYTVYQMTAAAVSGNAVPVTIRVKLAEGDNPNNVILRHYTGTPESGSWDSTPIPPEKITELPEHEAPYTHEFVFNVSKFSPFALTYEIPVKKSSSKQQGSSVWATEPLTPEPTVQPTPAAEPTQGPTVKPTEQPTPQAKSPAPFIGLLAGLGAAAALFGLRRK